MKMKNSIFQIFIVLFLSTSLFTSCNKNLDINQDPNNPTSVPENLMLSALLANFSYEINAGEPTRFTALWTKHIAAAVAGVHTGNYQLNSGDVNNLWNAYSYVDVMNNAFLLKEQATANGNPHYSAIAKIILAWNLSIVTDLFGDVPYSDAFKGSQGVYRAKYDSQEDVYKSIQSLLDQAITEAGNSENKLKPTSDDFIYGGKMENWIALAHTLKARFHLRLTNAPGYTAAAQAELAISELNKGAITAANQPKFKYADALGSENPWYQFAIDGKWATTTRPSQYYVNKLLASKDPRIAFQVAKVVAGDNVAPENVGEYIGITNEPPKNVIGNYSALGSFYSAADAPLYWLVYPEVEFIRAEAEFLKANKVPNQTVISAYEKAVQASMDFYGIDAVLADKYLDENQLSSSSDVAYSQIITEKYVANFLMAEPYNDYRRTGYPNLPINNEMYSGQTKLDQEPRLNQIPVRFPYPSSERLYNGENIPSNIPSEALKAMVIPVWWNSK
ncbi:SusD/RagB family nutrient-binding outer membrane lipoprotein [Sphingobacterium sp. C459-1T]|uniref:SusD/RagB family nutrient-binding outer membrane lipoprotein n=2 Tax=Sphingobacterium faecale TaxID=2803775 RepID=A0ABS1R866_9SPHI|nr:SusD/RagB family nutrient-binding outer membrane lipoprotein [Sphingobacterium faecale]